MNDSAPIPFNPGQLGAASAPSPGVPDNEGIEEVVLCAEDGEILHEWPTPGTGDRAPLFDPLFQFSDSLAQALSLGRPDRLEVDTVKGRLIFMLHPSRRLFVRTSRKGGKGLT